MLVTKRSLLWFFVGAEVSIFITMYLFGSHGIQKMRSLKKELVQVQAQKAVIQSEIDELSVTIHQWKTNDFHAEKLAREQLQMARPAEQLYVITRQTQKEDSFIAEREG